ncbi:uncharacterized protein LOC132300494 [Cornus florida]|uniref:uncharacterized protein LOC132300494 n=1 Tax=Cornus florida TaxID=4283 RepID=UPI00289F745E|nr:uncharacterized protein LOC132300494 [Cornus florida]
MNSVNPSLSISSSQPSLPYLFNALNYRTQLLQNPRNHHPNTPSTSSSYSASSFRPRRRRPRRRLNPNPFTDAEPTSTSDSKLQMAIDIEPLNKVSSSVERFLSFSELKYNQFVYSGNEALRDLQTLITVDDDRKVIVSCRRSTLQFIGSLALWGCVIVVAFRVLMKLGLGFREQLRYGYSGGVVTRRDRSLGGREVVVGVKKKEMNEFRVSKTPPTVVRGSETLSKSWVRKGQKLPDWWPVSLPPPVLTLNKEEYQREADRLIRAIMDNRMSGQDILEDDIIQLRQICRTSGVRVFIDTINVRNSIYRASVDFVLNNCSRVANYSTFAQIYGEDARQFIAGLADNIRLESMRAARIVSAAVAARTRSSFLQAWAFEMQGKNYEAVMELSKICLFHRIFPPEECSPEMEMVARGLEKHLKVEQREILMKMLVGVCGEESHRSVAEALGLMTTEGVGNYQENKQM